MVAAPLGLAWLQRVSHSAWLSCAPAAYAPNAVETAIAPANKITFISLSSISDRVLRSGGVNADRLNRFLVRVVNLRTLHEVEPTGSKRIQRSQSYYPCSLCEQPAVGRMLSGRLATRPLGVNVSSGHCLFGVLRRRALMLSSAPLEQSPHGPGSLSRHASLLVLTHSGAGARPIFARPIWGIGTLRDDRS